MLVSYLLNITAHTVRKISQKIFTKISQADDPLPVCNTMCVREGPGDSDTTPGVTYKKFWKDLI